MWRHQTELYCLPLYFTDICRVCRCEGAPDRPLFHPCICTGSIKFIHQECLLQWLRYSKKEFCELCTHRFSFTPSKLNTFETIFLSTLNLLIEGMLIHTSIVSHVCHFSIFTRYAEAIATLNSIQWLFRNSCSCSKILVALHNCGLSMARGCSIDCIPNIYDTFYRICVINSIASLECSFNVSKPVYS